MRRAIIQRCFAIAVMAIIAATAFASKSLDASPGLAWVEADGAGPRDLTEMAVQTIAPPPGLSRVEIRERRPGGEEIRLVAHHAIRAIGGARHLAMVVLFPEEMRGVAVLAQRRGTGEARIRIYDPRVGGKGRSARVDPLQPILDTDVNLEDLGLLDLRDRSPELLGSAEIAGVPAYGLRESAPSANGEAVVDWIAMEDGSLLRRESGPTSGAPSRRTLYESLSEVEGIPVAFFRRVTDARSGRTTDVHVLDVRHDVHVPKSLFDPRRIGEMAEHPAWTHLSEPTFEATDTER
jgi:hypothetical protein